MRWHACWRRSWRRNPDCSTLRSACSGCFTVPAGLNRPPGSRPRASARQPPSRAHGGGPLGSRYDRWIERSVRVNGRPFHDPATAVVRYLGPPLSLVLAERHPREDRYGGAAFPEYGRRDASACSRKGPTNVCEEPDAARRIKLRLVCLRRPSPLHPFPPVAERLQLVRRCVGPHMLCEAQRADPRRVVRRQRGHKVG